MTKVSVIVLNWNQPKLTLSTISSLLNVSKPNFSYHIYLVDNGSTDNSIKIFQKTYENNPLVTIHSTGKNLGYVGGNNFGIKLSDENSDYYLLCNNDIIVDKQFLSILVNQAQKNSKPCISGPKIYFYPGFEYHSDRYSKKDQGKIIWSAGGHIDWNNIIGSNIGIDQIDKDQFNKINHKIDFISGCCFLIHHKIIEKIGLLDESYYMYLEDADYCQRAITFGFDLIFVPQSKIWHLNAKSSGAGSSLHDYFLSRNRLLFGFRYAKLRTKLALIKESFKQLFTSSSSWQKRGIIDFYFHRFNQGSWAS